MDDSTDILCKRESFLLSCNLSVNGDAQGCLDTAGTAVPAALSPLAVNS